MRILFIFVGAIETIIGLGGFIIEITNSNIDKILGLSLAVTLLTAGILTIAAGLRRYRGGWRTLIGSLSLILAMMILGANLNAYLVPEYASRFDLKALTSS